jgi:hypothetical protein
MVLVLHAQLSFQLYLLLDMLARFAKACSRMPAFFHVVRVPMTHSSHKPTHYRSTAMYSMYIQPNKIGRASK